VRGRERNGAFGESAFARSTPPCNIREHTGTETGLAGRVAGKIKFSILQRALPDLSALKHRLQLYEGKSGGGSQCPTLVFIGRVDFLHSGTEDEAGPPPTTIRPSNKRN
jgi:hypothetical protein